MLRGMEVSGDEVELPAGVQAQALTFDRSAPNALRLVRRYPLGLMVAKGVLEHYRTLMDAVEKALDSRGPPRTTRDKRQMYWADKMGNRHELDAYEAMMQINSLVFENLDGFREAGMDVNVCHRARLDKSHSPTVDRWFEFVDLDQAPDYRSQWSVSTTAILPVSICVGSSELLSVYVPPVAVLKLLPQRFGVSAREQAAASTLLVGTIERAGLQEELEALVEDLQLSWTKAGLWPSAAVQRAVQRHAAAFRAKGTDVFFCELFCLATVDRLFQWIEFADMQLLPGYIPQYLYRPPLHEEGQALDKFAERYFEPTMRMRRLRIAGDRLRSRHLACFHNPPHVFWFEDIL